MSFQNHNDRRETADAAKKAMLEKFKTKAAAASVDPAEAAARVKAAEEKEAKRIATVGNSLFQCVP
jgi:dihydrodipicolinate synthase/N-acetylneuraminate lyase